MPRRLAQGKEIKGRDQNPHPSREGNRMEKDVRPGRGTLEQQAHDLQEKRLPKNNGLVLGQRGYLDRESPMNRAGRARTAAAPISNELLLAVIGDLILMKAPSVRIRVGAE